MVRRRFRVAAAALVLTGGVLYTATVGNDNLDPDAQTATNQELKPAIFSVTFARGRLRLEGATESAEHEAALLQLAADQYKHAEVQSHFEPAVLLPDNWSTMSNRLLYALAATEAGDASMVATSIRIHAVTGDEQTLTSRLKFLREAAGAHVDVATEILVIDVAESLTALCARTFAELELSPVSFKQSSSEFRESSMAPLHRLVDFANDCPNAVIAITGHTDATGDESWNRQLSLARAKAVANHLIENGVDTDRLVIEGDGSAQPIADNATAHGRELNRRIEFELR